MSACLPACPLDHKRPVPRCRENLNQKIQAQDWTKDINYRDQGTGACPSCGQDSGGGKFCKNCGTGLAAAPSAAKFCANCGTPLNGAKFCGECGTAAG